HAARRGARRLLLGVCHIRRADAIDDQGCGHPPRGGSRSRGARFDAQDLPRLERGLMEALKFLRPGRIGPFTGFAWPERDWVEADGEPELCSNGIHALATDSGSLATWVAEELWRGELEGAQVVAQGLLAARRGRLVSRVEEWNDATAREFAHACAAHVDRGSGRAAEYATD